MSRGRSASGPAEWVEQTRAQVDHEVAEVRASVTAAIDGLAQTIAAQSTPQQLVDIEGIQVAADAFLGAVSGLVDGVGERLSTALDERLTALVAAVPAGSVAEARTRAEVARQCTAIRHYLTYVEQYVAGYVQGGGVGMVLLIDLSDGTYADRAQVTRILRHRLTFVAERVEIAARRWADEATADFEKLAAEVIAAPPAPKPPPKPSKPPESAPPVDAARRLTELLAMAAEHGVKIKQIPDSPSVAWLDRLEQQLRPVVEKRKAAAALVDVRKTRLAELMAFAATLKVKVKGVPTDPTDAWLDKMEAKLAEVAQKQRVAVPETFAPPTSEESSRTSDLPPEREAAPVKDQARLAARVADLLKRAEEADVKLGRVPDPLAEEWVDATEKRLEEALASRRNARKAEREKVQRERRERITRIKAAAEEAGVDIGPVPPFPTDDWLARAEFKVADTPMAKGRASRDAGSDRLGEVQTRAEQLNVDLGDVPDDPDDEWFSDAEAKLDAANAEAGALIAGEEEGAEPKALFIYEEGTVQEQVWVMQDQELTIGRARGNVVQVRDDAGVSRQHCTVRRTKQGFVLKDLGSTKGTLVDDELVEKEQVLTDGQRVTVGATVFVFRLRE